MHMYEFEAKKWLHKFKIPLQIGDTAFTPAQARQISETLKYEGITDQCLKAQVLSGGRKKAGGIVLTEKPE